MAIKRNFTLRGEPLADPDPNMSPMDVKELYSSQHPELLNAVVVYHDPQGDVQQYEFQEKDSHGKAKTTAASSRAKVTEQNIEFKPSIGRKG